MVSQQKSSSNEYDLSLRLWSEVRPLKPIVSESGLAVDDLAVMGEEAEGWKGRKRIVRCHYACLASSQVRTERDATAWLAATLDQLDRTATRFGPDIEALFWIAQLRGEDVPSMIPDPALVARAAQAGTRVFIENYTLSASDDPDAESPVKTWYPPD